MRRSRSAKTARGARVLRWACLAAMLSLFAAAGPGGEGEPSAAAGGESWEGKVVLFHVTDKNGIFWDNWLQKGMVRDKVKNVFERMKRQTPRLLVVEIDSPGGRVDTCDELSKWIKNCPAPSAALVTHKAVSGGTVLATACNEIVMVKGSRIGDVKPILFMPGAGPAEPPAGLREKIERDVISLLESNAEANGHPKDFLRAMVSTDIELFEVTFSDGAREFLTARELEVAEENIEKGRDKRTMTDKKLVCEKGKLLELTAGEALAYGLAGSVVDSRETFFTERDITEADLVVAEVKGEDVEVRGLISVSDLEPAELLLLGLFLVFGIAGVLAEVNMPGFGVPGAIGLIGFGCFFAMLVLHGRAEWYEIALFVAGIVLLVVEIVVIPGFGVPGLLGVTCILAGLFMAFTPSFGTPYMHRHFWDQAASFVLFLTGVLFVVGILGYLMISYGDKLPFLRYLYMATAQRHGAEVLADNRARTGESPEKEEAARRGMVGRCGAATTPLRPAGKVRLDSGELIDVVTEGGLIANGARVIVLDTAMNRIVVGPAPETTSESAPPGDDAPSA